MNKFQALWVTFAFYIAHTVMALPSATVLRRIGYKNGMTMGLGAMAVGALLFIPAAKSGRYGLFLMALFTLATGMTLVQTAINPYIVCIGSRESAAMRISIMGLFNKVAEVVVPLVFWRLYYLASTNTQTQRWRSWIRPAGQPCVRSYRLGWCSPAL